jgi:hypothetical protein
MSMNALSRRAVIATGFAAGAAAFAPVLAQGQMTTEKMRALVDYTLRRNREDNKTPVQFSTATTPFLFGRPDVVLVLQIGNDEGALKERFSVTTNLQEQQVILFSRTEDAVYFHLTGTHLRRTRSAVNRRVGGASRWTASEAATDFARQLSYWATRSTS